MFLFNDLKMKKKIYHTVITVSKSYSKSENQRLKSILLMLIAHVPGLGTDHLTWRGGGYDFLFDSEIFFRTTQELEYLFFLSPKARIFFPEFNITLYDKNSESDYFVFLHQYQNIFFSNIGNQNICLEKNHNPPFKLNGRSLSDMIRPWKYVSQVSTITYMAMDLFLFYVAVFFIVAQIRLLPDFIIWVTRRHLKRNGNS